MGIYSGKTPDWIEIEHSTVVCGVRYWHEFMILQFKMKAPTILGYFEPYDIYGRVSPDLAEAFAANGVLVDLLGAINFPSTFKVHADKVEGLAKVQRDFMWKGNATTEAVCAVEVPRIKAKSVHFEWLNPYFETPVPPEPAPWTEPEEPPRKEHSNGGWGAGSADEGPIPF